MTEILAVFHKMWRSEKVKVLDNYQQISCKNTENLRKLQRVTNSKKIYQKDKDLKKRRSKKGKDLKN